MANERTTATVLMSGGIDSAACAYHLRSQGLIVNGIFVDYGQNAVDREAQAVATLASHLRIKIQKIKVDSSKKYGSGELPGRNAFLIFTALFFRGGRSGLIGLGLHAGTPYYDCSEEFVLNIGKLVAEHTDGKVSVVAPFINWTKRDVYDYFLLSKIPIESTYSCEAGTLPICGSCASCGDRKALGC